MVRNNDRRIGSLGLALTTCALAGIVNAQQITPYDSMMRGDSPDTSNGWDVLPVVTIGEPVGDYLAPGVLDGISAFALNRSTVRIFVHHELNPDEGYAYQLANGTELTGARISYFDVNRRTFRIMKAGPAYDTVYDREGNVVTDPAQINETGNQIDGFARFCSGGGVEPGQYGFVDFIHFANEETGKPDHPHGGSVWAVDLVHREIWAAPALGRGAWENVTPVATGRADKIALLMGDDTEAAPLYLWVGDKNGTGDGSFLDRNGLKVGRLYAWKSDSGDLNPEDFNGFFNSRSGSFVQVQVRDESMAGEDGYDALGYLDVDTLQQQADDLGCFSFSRPEDLHANPYNGSEVVFASTGRGGLYPSDNWGTVYIVSLDFSNLSAIRGDLFIIHDADHLPVPDAGIRSPDNVTWALDGYIYLQEDRSTSPSNLFGQQTGIEASMWQLNPWSGQYMRIGEIDRSAVAPIGTTDSGEGDLGNWESSGVLDVTRLFKTVPGETVLVADVQAHGIRDGIIADENLVQGGQLIFLSNKRRVR